MARKDALKRLYNQLVTQRAALRRSLSEEMGLTGEAAAGSSDPVDAAYDDSERELNSQLAALEGRELVRIEAALTAMRDGRYGLCDGCAKPIPIARLQVLPYTSSCVECQRTVEGRRKAGHADADWESAWEHGARQRDQELSVRELDMQ
ncbi:MAG TPA: TraR/DksA family transcriptional regulator [Caulifigura sp.]|nr:TraR/DksA family transcriptional regulator [Caulifigura sp.]